MPNDMSMNDTTNKPKKGLLQSLHSLTFSDDQSDDEDTTDVLENSLDSNTPSTDNMLQNTSDSSMSDDNVSSLSNDLSLENTSSEEVKSDPVVVTPVKEEPVMAGPVGPTFTAPKPSFNPFNKKSEDTPIETPSTPVVEEPAVVTAPEPVYNAPIESKASVEPDLADTSVTLDTIENSLTSEMRKSMDSVKDSSINIKQKTNYDLITSFGIGSREVLVFNTFLTKEMPYTSKSGKSGTQRVNFFGVMTESGVYAIRASSAITSKLEDALKHTMNMQDDTVGLLGDGTARRFVMKLPAEEYGSNNVLHISLVGDATKQNPDAFTGLDAVNIDMQFIEDLMTLAVSEVEAMLDYEKRRRANLKELQNQTNAEVKKATAISDKLSTLSL